MSEEDQKAALKEALAASTAEARRDVLKSASQGVSNVLWFVVFGILGAVVIGGGLLGLSADGSDETALFGFVGIALGAIVGLLAPSAGSTK